MRDSALAPKSQCEGHAARGNCAPAYHLSQHPSSHLFGFLQARSVLVPRRRGLGADVRVLEQRRGVEELEGLVVVHGHAVAKQMKHAAIIQRRRVVLTKK